MLSICGSIYMNRNFLTFVQSVLDFSSAPEDIEFVVVEDEAGSDLMAKCFDEARALTKRLTVIRVTKEERIRYIRQRISFYETEAIFPPDRIAEFRERLARYETGQMPRLWFPPMRNYNLAVAASSGDVVLNTPVDLSVHFDLSATYRQFKQVLATAKRLCVLFGLRGGNPKRQHGIKMFDRGLFDAVKILDRRVSPTPFGFDERWFENAFCEDGFNERAMGAGGTARGWEEMFGERRLFSMPPSPWFPEYLCRNMAADHPFFMKCIKEYLARPVSP